MLKFVRFVHVSSSSRLRKESNITSLYLKMFGSCVITRSRLFYGLISLIPAFFWARFFRTCAKLRVELKAKKLFHDRHNCVVMYSKARGVVGWPEHLQEPSKGTSTKPSTRVHVYDSILYFIDTAEKSLDIAMMMINIPALANAVIKAHKRGIKVRVLVDFSYSKRSNCKDFENAGIAVLYYVSPDPAVCSIMHYKHMLKDYSNGHGFVYTGSLNWTNSGVEQNYESTVFTTNRNLVKDIKQNFEDSWKFVKELSQNNNYVKAKLIGVQ